MAEKHLARTWYEEIMPLSPYIYITYTLFKIADKDQKLNCTIHVISKSTRSNSRSKARA